MGNADAIKFFLENRNIQYMITLHTWVYYPLIFAFFAMGSPSSPSPVLLQTCFGLALCSYYQHITIIPKKNHKQHVSRGDDPKLLGMLNGQSGCLWQSSLSITESTQQQGKCLSFSSMGGTHGMGESTLPWKWTQLQMSGWPSSWNPEEQLRSQWRRQWWPWRKATMPGNGLVMSTLRGT